jgi:proteasome accessory factor C
VSYATTQRLRRLLLLLPVAARASRDGRGVPLATAVRLTGARSEKQLREDIAAVSRLWTEPGSGEDAVDIYLEDGEVFVTYAIAFGTPPAFSLAEGAVLRSILTPFEAEGGKPVRDAVRKLRKAVPEPLRAVADRLAKGLDLPGKPPGPWDAALQDAIDRRVETTIEYRAVAEGGAARRVVEPRVLFQGGNGEWYLAAWNVEKSAEHLFRLDRIVSVEPGTRVFGEHKGPPVERYRGRNLYFQSGAEREVTLRFSGLAARLARERTGQQVEERSGGYVAVKLKVTPGNYLLGLVLGHGGEATVEAPADVAEALRARARALLEAYR